jgi:hypothetical protein
LVANTTSTAAVNLLLSIVHSAGTSVRPLGLVNVPLSSGNVSGVLNVDVLNPTVLNGMTVDQNGKRIIRLAPSETLK